MVVLLNVGCFLRLQWRRGPALGAISHPYLLTKNKKISLANYQLLTQITVDLPINTIVIPNNTCVLSLVYSPPGTKL